MSTSAPANWIGFTVPLPGQDLLEGIRDILEVLLIFLEIATAILETIKIFLLLLANPLIALLEALIALILELFMALQQTGLYAYFDLPDLHKDPNFKKQFGGFQAFKLRWKGSLLDVRDSHRPQPVAGLLEGGFFLFVIDSDGIIQLIQLVQSIMAFFKDPKAPEPRQYAPPVHLAAFPLRPGSADPVLTLVDGLSAQSTDLAIEWQLPGIVPTGDAGFAGLTSQVVQAFQNPNWLIELGLTPPLTSIQATPDIGGNWNSKLMTDPTSTGRLVQQTSTPYSNPRSLGTTFTGLAPITDQYNDPIIKFSFYAVVDGFSAFLANQSGTVSFVFKNAPLDQDIYIRVRAYFGDLDTTPIPGDNPNGFVAINWRSPLVKWMSDGSGVFKLPWPSQAGAPTQMHMGKPSKMIHARISPIPDIDVIGDITALLQCGFSLNFHVSLPAATPVFVSPGGPPALDARGNPIYKPQFDSAGNPIPPLTTADIGKGSMTDMGGGAAGLLFGAPPSNVSAADFQPDPVTGQLPQMPWQNGSVVKQSRLLAIRFASILMEQGGPLIAAFKNVMRGPLSGGAITISWPDGTPTYLEKLVLSFTKVTVLPPNLPAGASPATVAQVEANSLPTTTVDLGTYEGFQQAFFDVNVRRNILAGINFLKSLNYQGVPPDWRSVSLLDLIPWAGQFLYEIIAKIQALIDAFAGVIAEIINFINMLERKIATLEAFIEYLIAILNFLLSLEIGFFVLPVPFIDGDTSSWMSTIDLAQGTIPPSGPDGYTAGICLAYLGPDISGIAAAFAILF